MLFTPDLLGRLSAARDRRARERKPDDSIDRRGYARSPVTKRGYRLGQDPPNKGRKFPPEPLTRAEMLALLESFPTGACGERNRALAVVMWRAGLRIGEALSLYPKDIDTERGQIAVLHGKGDRDRIVGLDPGAVALMNPWLVRRRQLGLDGSYAVFCVVSRPTTGQPMHAAYVRNMVKEAALRAGIEKRVTPHVLRHTHAFELADERVDLRLIRRQLGHGNLAVTARYIEHLNPFEVVEAIRARPWPGPGPSAPTDPVRHNTGGGLAQPAAGSDARGRGQDQSRAAGAASGHVARAIAGGSDPRFGERGSGLPEQTS